MGEVTLFAVIPAKRSASRNPGSSLACFSASVSCMFTFGIFPDATFSQSQLPEGVRNVGIDQRLNEQLPLDIEFRNEEGRLVRIGDFFNEKPVDSFIRLSRVSHALQRGVGRVTAVPPSPSL